MIRHYLAKKNKSNWAHGDGSWIYYNLSKKDHRHHYNIHQRPKEVIPENYSQELNTWSNLSMIGYCQVPLLTLNHGVVN